MGAAYRADQVGSFLRPSEIKEAHTAHREGRLSVVVGTARKVWG